MAKETNPRSFVLRVDAATMDALEAWAEDEFRSINGQLQWIIADALRRSGRLKKPRAAAGATLPDAEAAAGASDPAGQTAAPSEADAPARSAGGKGKAGRAAAAEDESDTRAAIEPKSQVQ